MDSGPAFLYNIPVLPPGRYFSPLAPESGPEPGDLHLEVIGLQVAERAVRHQPGGFPFWRLMFFHQPTAVQIGDLSLPCAGPAAYLLPPGMETRYGRENPVWSHSWFRFSGNLKGIVDRDWVARPGPKPCTAEFWGNWATLIHQECFGNHPGAMARFRHLLQVLLGSLRPIGLPDRIPDGLGRARHHIDTHWRERFSLEDLAALAAWSPRHFCTRFRDVYGESPLAYQAHLRVRHAAEALRETDLSVADVAEACGWNDVFHFSKQFRKIQGLSPRKWRQRERGGHAPGAPSHPPRA